MSCFGVGPSESESKDLFICSLLSHREEADGETSTPPLALPSIDHTNYLGMGIKLVES